MRARHGHQGRAARAVYFAIGVSAIMAVLLAFNAAPNLRRDDEDSRPDCDFLNNMCFGNIDVDEKGKAQWWGVLIEVTSQPSVISTYNPGC